MESFVIEGGCPISGTVTPIGNKNAALPLLAACLLTDEPVTLHNVPQIDDVLTMMEILSSLGVSIERGVGQDEKSVTLCAAGVSNTSPDSALFSQIRGSLTLMGPLLARHGHFAVKGVGRRR